MEQQIGNIDYIVIMLYVVFYFMIFSCCNTCEDVREAYRLKGWAMTNLEDYAQCKDEHVNKKAGSAFSEGCQIHGYMEVNRVSVLSVFY